MEYNNLPTTTEFYHIILENSDHPKTVDEFVSIIAKELNLSKDDLAIKNKSNGAFEFRRRVRESLNMLAKNYILTKLDDGKYGTRKKIWNSYQSF